MLNRTLLGLIVALSTLVAASSNPIHAGTVTEAVTAPDKDLELAFTVGGKVEEVLVKRGEAVKKGQILMKLEGKEQRAQIEQVKFNISSADKQIEQAQKTAELYGVEAERMKFLYEEKEAASKYEFQRAQIQFELGKIDVQIAEQQKEGLKLELNKQEAIYDRYFLRAPIDGVIEEVPVSEGETVEPLSPIVMLVNTNILKIDADVHITDALKVNVGDTAWIRSDLEGFDKTLTGEVTFKAKVGDSASETLRIGIEVSNEADLAAGTSVKISFRDPARVASSETAGRD